MKTFKLIAIAAGMAALAACGGDRDNDELNAANADMTDLNAADTTLPPADMNADLNAGANAGAANDMNAIDNSANNSVNAY